MIHKVTLLFFILQDDHKIELPELVERLGADLDRVIIQTLTLLP